MSARMSVEARIVYVERRLEDRDRTVRYRMAVRSAWAAKGVLL